MAELAFAVLFALLAVLLPTYRLVSDRNAKLEAEIRKSASNAAEFEKVKAQIAELANLRAQNAALQGAIEAARKNLRSTALPACIELDKNAKPLFSATIISDHTFAIEGGQYSMPMILQRFGGQISAAKKRGCVERVQLYYRGNLNAHDYDEGFRKMRQYFYPMLLGER